jgi:hypothetical protein
MNRAQFIHLAALGLNEWMRRFTEEPERFQHEFRAVSDFLQDQQAGAVPTYGLVGAFEMARYLDDVANVADGVIPAEKGDGVEIPSGWERIASPDEVEKTCALVDAARSIGDPDFDEVDPAPHADAIIERVEVAFDDVVREIEGRVEAARKVPPAQLAAVAGSIGFETGQDPAEVVKDLAKEEADDLLPRSEEGRAAIADAHLCTCRVGTSQPWTLHRDWCAWRKEQERLAEDAEMPF